MTRVAVVTSLLVVVAAVATGCGNGAGSSGGKKGEPATLNVGVIPIADVAPLYVGMDRGYFKQEKLTIKPKIADGGAAIVAQTVSGDDQIGFSNTTSLLIASSRKLPLQIVTQGVVGAQKPGPETSWDAVLVRKGSSIKTPKDLEGKTVSVNSLKNVGPLTINTALAKEGVDYKKVKYVEVPFPDANAALESGKIDAAWVVEPFVGQGLAAGSKPLLFPYEQTAPGLTVANYFTTKQYSQSNPDVVARFKRAMNKSLEYSQQHPEAVRKAVTTYTKIPPKVAQAMKLPRWTSDLNRPTIERTAKLAEQYGYTKGAPDLDALLPEQ